MLLKKMMGVILLVGLLMGIFFWLPVVLSAEPPADLTVDTLVDEEDGSCSDGDCSLRDAILLAPEGGSIDFGVTGNLLLSSVLVIERDLVVEGPGPGDLELQDYGIEIRTGANVILRNFTMLYSNTGQMGAVYNEGDLTMEGIRVFHSQSIAVNNFGVFVGDGLLFQRVFGVVLKVAEGADLTLTNSIIDNNSSHGIENRGTVYVADTMISRNRGIGVYNTDSGVVELVRVDFDRQTRDSSVQNDGAEAVFVVRESIVRAGDGDVSVYNVAGEMYIEKSVMYGNKSNYTPIIENYDRLEIVNSTITDNDSFNDYMLRNQGMMTVTYSTIANNHDAIGNVVELGARLWLGHTILANNDGPNCWGEEGIISLGYNWSDELDYESRCNLIAEGDIIDRDPMLGELADNGGPTETLALLMGSPVIGKGNCAVGGESVDQRGVARPYGGSCDIGAYEYDGGFYVETVDDFYAMEQGTVLELMAPGVMANDSYAGDGEQLFTLLSSPAVGTLDLLAGGGFRYEPPVDFEGEAVFRYRVEEGGYADEAVVRIEVRGDSCWATLDDGVTVLSSWDATALLEAVEAVSIGGVVKVAGVCQGEGEVRSDSVVALVYAEKPFSLLGGYSADNWMMAYPEVQPTIIDAQHEGSVIVIDTHGPGINGDMVLAGLRVINGNAGGVLLYIEHYNQVIIRDSYVENNQGDSIGGLEAMGVVSIERTVIANNVGGLVGGVDLDYASWARMSDSIVEGNMGGLVGGVNATMSRFILENSLIAYNGAEGDVFNNYHETAGGLLIGQPDGTDSVIMNSTISHNWVENGYGGGIYHYPMSEPLGGPLTVNGGNSLRGVDDDVSMDYGSSYIDIHNSTIVHNQAGWGAGGVMNTSQMIQSEKISNIITFTNSIVAYNGEEQCISNGELAVIRTGGYNMADDASCRLTGEGDMENTDPLVGPLLESGVTAEGGVAWTHYLPGSSPARNAIPMGVNGCGAEGDRDQRGMARPLEGACDMGAHEMGRPTLGIISGVEIELMEGGTAVIGLNLAYGIDVPVTVDYELVGGTAEGGVDSTETAGTITIGAGETEAEVVIEIVDDALVEGREWFYVHLSSVEVTVGGGWVRITIVDDDSLTEKMYLPAVVR
ncbi:MAG TPA: choice-of-anchor Q domain-containing protein [Anaerolineae bacterium]|nr:choice-of-anchor Q domain-containing protein [Anaerolineae bacterium]